MTKKEKILAKGFLSDETCQLLKVYLPTIINNENPYLFSSGGKKAISDDTVNATLKVLAKKAGIVVPKWQSLT